MKQKKEGPTTMTQKEHYRLIRSEMVKRGVTNVEICEEADVSRQRLSDVMLGKAKGYRIRRLIAQKCGVPVEILWPDTPPNHRAA